MIEKNWIFFPKNVMFVKNKTILVTYRTINFLYSLDKLNNCNNNESKLFICSVLILIAIIATIYLSQQFISINIDS